MIIRIDITEEHLPFVVDRLRHYGALEIDNANNEQQEAEGIVLRDLADRIERAQEVTYSIEQDLEEMSITDSLGNELRATSGEGGVEYVSVMVGPIEYFIGYYKNADVNAWIAESADVQLDRRASTVVHLHLPVAKLQDQPEIERLLSRFKEEIT